MEPAAAAAHDRFPVEVAGLELGSGFVGAIIKDDGSADAMTLVAIDRRHVWSGDAVVLEALVKRPDAHGTDALGNQIADRIIDHRGCDARFLPKAIGEVRGDIELAAADVNLTLSGLAERNNARVEAIDEGSEGEEIEVAFGGDVEADGGHGSLAMAWWSPRKRGFYCRATRASRRPAGEMPAPHSLCGCTQRGKLDVVLPRLWLIDDFNTDARFVPALVL